MKKFRICICYSPIMGTWYIIQKRIFFWWKSYPFAFKELYMANQFLNIHSNKESFLVTPLTYNPILKKFVEYKDVKKTSVVTVKMKWN